MEVGFARQRLRTTSAHCVESDMHQANVHALYVGLTEPCCAEMTRQELQEAEMRRDEIVNVLLVFRQCLFVGRCEFLLIVEGILVSVKSVSKSNYAFISLKIIEND